MDSEFTIGDEWVMKGANWLGQCPKCKENSMEYNPARHWAHCFKCGTSGPDWEGAMAAKIAKVEAADE